MSSKIPALLDYLVTLFTAAGNAASPPFTVYDGPVTADGSAKLILWVGLTDPDSDAADSAATFNQARSDLSQGRDETSAINCVAQAWSGIGGPGDFSVLRSQANALLAAVETAIRSDVTNFGGNGQAQPGVTGGEWTQNAVQGAGLFARVRFQIQFRSLNT